MPDMEKTSVKAVYQQILNRLQSAVGAEEASPQAYWLLEGLFGKKRMDVIMDAPLQLVPEAKEQLEDVLRRLEKGEPIQYVLGEAPFYGRSFKVNRAVLIPRPETEELVQLICGQYGSKQDLKLLDIGTGSGCIATTLALELPGPKVYAIDVSADALLLAEENARRLGAEAEFIECNILEDYPTTLPSLDIIVSNPPYVMRKEASLMKANVLDWEPAVALFVEDEDPLLFYRCIACLARKQLKKGGRLYFEINESCGKEVVEMLEKQGFSDIAIHQDLQGKPRMVEARWRE